MALAVQTLVLHIFQLPMGALEVLQQVGQGPLLVVLVVVVATLLALELVLLDKVTAVVA
jgi:hypothetical protein